MNNKAKVLKILGHIFLALSVLAFICSIILWFDKESFVSWGISWLFLGASPVILLLSIVFYLISKKLSGSHSTTKEKLLTTRSNKTLAINVFTGSILAAISYYIASLEILFFSTFAIIGIIIGLFIVISSIIELIINYFKKKKLTP